MGRLFFLLFVFLFCPTGIVIALDSDRNHPAIVDAQDIEIDFATGRWIYRGDVTIQQGTLHMTADEIHLFFEGDVLQRAIAHGQPAVFQQQPEDSDHLIRGQAKTIEIDEIESVAIFSGEAKLQQRHDTITGETIIYHMNTERMAVHGNSTMLSQTTRLSTSDATETTTSVRGNLNARPKVIIQPQAKVANEESANTYSEPSVLSTAIDTDSESTSQATNNEDTTEKKPASSSNSLRVQAARIIGAGTAAYNEPRADAAVLGGLSGQMPVKVLEIRNGWARVTIPNGINVWVFGSYLTEDRNGRARVQGQGVRARWLPSTDSRIVGVLPAGESVRVLTTQNQWKQITLPPSIAAWIPGSQLEILDNMNPAWRSDWQTQTGHPPKIGN